jgi:hypothetical protein
MKMKWIILAGALVLGYLAPRAAKASATSPHAAGKEQTTLGVNIIPPDNGASGYSNLY